VRGNIVGNENLARGGWGHKGLKWGVLEVLLGRVCMGMAWLDSYVLYEDILYSLL